MRVSDLIELLSSMDPNLDVKISSPTGGFMEVNSAEVEIERDGFDQDFDRTIVLLS